MTGTGLKFVATLCGAACLMASPLGHADPMRGGMTARTLERGGAQMLKRGLERIAPRLIEEVVARAESGAAELALLDKKLSEKPGLKPLYGTSRFLFLDARGLSTAGRELVDWLGQAPFHAISLDVPPTVSELSTSKVALPGIDVIEAAWASAISGDKFDETVKALANKVEVPPDARRVEVEVALAERYVALVLALPSRVRQSVVLEDEEGRYLSPDVLWRNEAPMAEEARNAALATAFEMAKAGKVKPHLDALAPKHWQYGKLVAAAQKYAEFCRSGGWAPLEVPKDDKAARKPDAVKALKSRLAREGLWGEPPDAVTETWDEAFEKALIGARSIRQLREKPEYDKALVEALNVPCEERLRTLTLNVRRWRYSAWNGEVESVQVNLAGQVMRYFRDNALVMKQRTVVGSNKSFFSKSENRRIWRNASPILHDTIETIIVNPDWNVPPRIAREEIDVEVAKDPTYLEKKGFRVVETAAGNLYVQGPGPGNALGRIKILFPNSESVYLHDTPGRNAFKLPVRALSHGCVRVDNAMDFGIELLAADHAKRGVAFDAKRTRHLGGPKPWPFRLEHQVPVFFEYYTASVDEEGAVWFHPDIYGYDAETWALEAAKPKP